MKVFEIYSRQIESVKKMSHSKLVQHRLPKAEAGRQQTLQGQRVDTVDTMLELMRIRHTTLVNTN